MLCSILRFRARTVGAGGIISEVNGQKIKIVEDFRLAVPESIKTGYLTIKTTDNQFVALTSRDNGRRASSSIYLLL